MKAKAFCYSYVTRTAAFLLTVLCAVVVGLSALLTAAGVKMDFYEDPDRYAREVCRECAAEASRALVSAWQAHLDRDGDEPFDPVEVCEEYPNVLFLLTDPSGALLYATEDGADARPSEEPAGFSAAVRLEDSKYFTVIVDRETEQSVTLTVRAGVRETLIPGDRLSRYLRMLDFLAAAVRAAPWLILTGLATGAACVVLLCCAAGHKRDEDAPHLTWIDRVPLDLTALIVACFAYPTAFVLLTGFAPAAVALESWPWPWIAAAVSLAVIAAVLLWLLLTLSARITAGGWWRNNIVVYLGRGLLRLFRWACRGVAALLRAGPAALPLWLGFLVLCALEAVLLRTYRGVGFWLLEKAALTVWLAMLTVWLGRLRRGARGLAEGHLDAQVDLSGMPPLLREHGAQLNSLGEVLTQAVEERTRSERMKAELITNVSHDLKTPLTSIVNYVDLLKKEPMEGERAQEYLTVLDRQSQRMKKLITDLVEASKASTGNLTAHPEPVSLDLMLAQLAGEYRDRMTAAGLELVSEADADCRALADVRLLGRVFDNLLGNAVKYAMPGTRVYLAARREENAVAVTLKNVSRERLLISGEELTERFVRGDASRSTEGSGLGLSIAKSLIELQQGTFTVSADGDLFKVAFTLPLAPS